MSDPVTLAQEEQGQGQVPVQVMPMRRAQRKKKKSHHKKPQVPQVGTPDPLANRFTASINARWDAARASEAETRQRFRTLPVDEALAELAAIRKTCEFASFEINQRLTSEEMRCEICSKPINPNKPPALVHPKRDPATGTVRNLFYCSAYCVRERNRAELGLAQDIK